MDAGFGWLFQTEIRHRLALHPNAKSRHRSTEFDYVFSTNSLGFRGPDISQSKPENTFRIAVIGDSFIAGLGVENGQTLTAELESLLNEERNEASDFQVLNRGRPGSGTIREFDLYRSYTRPFDPDVVVLAFCLGNDLVDTQQEQSEEEMANWSPPGMARKVAFGLMPNLYLELAMLKRATQENRQLAERSEAEFLDSLGTFADIHNVSPKLATERFRTIPEKYQKMAYRGEFGNDFIVFNACVQPNRTQKSLFPTDEQFQDTWPRVEHHLDLLRQTIREDGAQFVVMSIPDVVMVDRSGWEFYRSLGYKLEEDWMAEPSRTEEALAAWCTQNEVPYLNLVPPCRVANEELFYPMDGHFTPAGQRRAAEWLGEFLQSQNLLP